MVSTRGHPRAFPEPASATSTPAASLRTGRSTSRSNGSASSPPTPSSAVSTRRSASASSSSANWSHTPSNLAILWLVLSLPLVIWDTAYVLLRPYSLPGGSLHYPIFAPYELYGSIDGVYSARAWRNKFGFTGAQGLMNVAETALYILYLALVFRYGKEIKAKGRGAPKKSAMPSQLQWLLRARTVGGPEAGQAALVAFTAAVMTVSKTILYMLVQYCSDWADVRHNGYFHLIVTFFMMNGLWIFVPGYLAYVFGQEILEGLNSAAGNRKRA